MQAAKEDVSTRLDKSDDIQRDGKAQINNTITYNRGAMEGWESSEEGVQRLREGVQEGAEALKGTERCRAKEREVCRR